MNEHEEHERRTELSDNQTFFKCSACGCEELDVIRRFTRSIHVESTSACDCGKEGEAAVRRYRIDSLHEHVGTFDDSHQFELDHPEELETLGTEEEGYEVGCSDCAAAAHETCWQR